MKKTKIITKSVEIQDKIICNKCGNESLPGYGLPDCVVTGGYDSPVLPDFSKYEFDLCEICVDELMKSFKIPVEREVWSLG